MGTAVFGSAGTAPPPRLGYGVCVLPILRILAHDLSLQYTFGRIKRTQAASFTCRLHCF